MDFWVALYETETFPACLGQNLAESVGCTKAGVLGWLTYSLLPAENLRKTECSLVHGKLSTLKSYGSLTACCSCGLKAVCNKFKISCYVSNWHVWHLKISNLALTEDSLKKWGGER